MSDNAKILLEGLEEIWNTGDAEAIPEYYHPDFRVHYANNQELTFADLAGDLKASIQVTQRRAIGSRSCRLISIDLRVEK